MSKHRLLGTIAFACIAPITAVIGPLAAAAAPPSACSGKDAHALGHQDGSQGLDASRLVALQSTCGASDAPLDTAAYHRGWQEGVLRYCSTDNAFELGTSGASYRNVCPEHLSSAFHEAFYAGRRLYHAQNEIAELEEVLRLRSAELDHVSRDLAETELHLVRADAGAVERTAWVAEAKALAREQRDLEADIDALEREITAQKDDLDLLRSSVVLRD